MNLKVLSRVSDVFMYDLYVALQDANDNAPIITAANSVVEVLEDFLIYELSFNRPATLTFSIQATDADSPVSFICIINSAELKIHR